MTKKHQDIISPIKLLLKDLKIDYDDKMISEIIAYFKKDFHFHEYKEVEEILKSLKSQGYKLGLLTNSLYQTYEKLVEKTGLEQHFDFVVKSFDVGFLKPDPRMFKLMLDKFSMDKKEIVMVGDSMKKDVAGAEGSGIKAILIDRNDKHKEYPMRVRSLKEINKFL
jgi:2-haloalkanoic acid dehalogenase type II